jgi:hypothetical protein
MSSAICHVILGLQFRLLFNINNHRICGLTPHPLANIHICGNLLLIQNLFAFAAMCICRLFIDAINNSDNIVANYCTHKCYEEAKR